MMGFRNFAAPVSLALAVAVGLASAGVAQAQQKLTRIWEVPLGTPASQVPPEFMITACGTHGGPPSTPLRGFREFDKCAAEPETGLREVWFGYDDEREYFLRAIRAPQQFIDQNRANQLAGLLVVYSLLFDSEGRVQGYRIATDPREDPEVRAESDMLLALNALAFGAEGWQCTDLPRLEGEEPFGGLFVKRFCEKVDQGRYITILSHRYLRAGQRADRAGEPMANEFEVGTWIEMVNAKLVGKAPR